MKQHINIEQLSQLSGKGMKKYIKFFKLEHVLELADSHQTQYLISLRLPTHTIPLASIGQMIEFLDRHAKYFDVRGHKMDGGVLINYPRPVMTWDIDGGPWSEIEDMPVLCDALWEACLAILNK